MKCSDELNSEIIKPRLLMDSEDFFRQFGESMGEVVWIGDPQHHKVKFVSSAYEKVWGRSRQSLYEDPSSLFDAIHPDDKSAAIEEIEDGIRRGSLDTEFRIVRPDGSIRWIWARAFTKQQRNGHLESEFYGIAFDITQRKKMDQRRAGQYSLSSILSEASSISEALPKVLKSLCETGHWDVGDFWMKDKATRSLRCTALWHKPDLAIPDFESLTMQLSFKPGVGLPGRTWQQTEPIWVEIEPEEDDEFSRATLAFEAGLQNSVGFPIMVQGKTVAVMTFHGRSLREADPDLLQLFCAVGTQIGLFIERKQAQEALRKSREQAQKQREDIMAALAHELQISLLGADRVFKLMLEDKNEAPGRLELELLSKLHENNHHALGKLQNLMQVCRYESGAHGLHPEPINLRMLLEELSKQTSCRNAARKAMITVKFEGEFPPVMADYEAMTRLFTNLLDNAIKFSLDRPTIKVSGRMLAKDVLVSIKDAGPGMEIDSQSQLFDHFFHHSSGSNYSTGVGLGLYLCRQIVEAHRGKISCVSEPGEGTMITVRLPLQPITITQD